MDDIWTPYCGPAPSPGDVFAHWNFDPALILSLVAGFVFLWIWRGGRRERGFLSLAAAMLAVIFISPFCALSSALFTARTVHHLLLVLAAAPLIAAALPRSAPRLMTATAVQACVFWAWHAPAAYSAALSNDVIYWVMQASILGSAIWFWRMVRFASGPAAVIALLAAMLLMGLLGALITFAGQPLYAPHFATTLVWGMTPLEDQQAAGLIMWAPATVAYLAAALWKLNGVLSPPKAEAQGA